MMNYPLRNLIYEKIRHSGNLTDVDLMNILSKEGIQVTEVDLEKVLLRSGDLRPSQSILADQG